MKNKYKQKNIDMCIRLIARHDYTALEEFYKEFSNPIYRFSLMLLHDSHLAEDAMQNTFVKIMANAKSYSPGTNPRAWIFAIARNVCMDYCKIVDKPRNPLKNKGFRRITGEKYY